MSLFESFQTVEPDKSIPPVQLVIPAEPIVHGGRFEQREKLGSGSYGSVYKVYDRVNDEYYAMKIITYNRRAARELSALDRVIGRKGFLQIVHHFKSSYNTLHIIFSLVGTTLRDYIKTFYKKKVDLRTVVLIADQLISLLHTLHRAGWIHRDIKTDNLAMGLDDGVSVLYLLDLGLVKKIKSDNNRHIYRNSGHALIGNSRYCSLNSHRGYTLSRRDDLESVAYLLICMLKGKLPWSDRRDYQTIYRQKKSGASVLCEGLEPEFADFLRYARKLDFKQKPDYAYLRSLFKQIADRHDFEYNGIFSWMNEETKSKIRKKIELRMQQKAESLIASVEKDKNQANAGKVDPADPKLTEVANILPEDPNKQAKCTNRQANDQFINNSKLDKNHPLDIKLEEDHPINTKLENDCHVDYKQHGLVDNSKVNEILDKPTSGAPVNKNNVNPEEGHADNIKLKKYSTSDIKLEGFYAKDDKECHVASPRDRDSFELKDELKKTDEHMQEIQDTKEANILQVVNQVKENGNDDSCFADKEVVLMTNADSKKRKTDQVANESNKKIKSL